MSDAFRVFENLQDVVLIIDEEQNVHFGNAAASNLLDVSPRRLSGGKPLANFLEFSPGLLEEGSELAQIDEPTPSREIQFTSSGNGTTGWAQVSLQAWPEALVSALGAETGSRWIIYYRWYI